jgi:hypothetical protein
MRHRLRLLLRPKVPPSNRLYTTVHRHRRRRNILLIPPTLAAILRARGLIPQWSLVSGHADILFGSGGVAAFSETEEDGDDGGY